MQRPLLVLLGLWAVPLLAQNPCGTPHLVGMPHPANATSTRLYDVCAFGPNDVWAVGQRWADLAGQTNSFAFILHWDGAHFTEVPCPSPGIPNLRTWCELRTIGGSGPNDLWAAGQYERQHPNNGHVGPQIFLLHWDGSTWTQVPEPMPQFTYMASSSGSHVNQIIANASNDVWFFGRWSGDQFTSSGPLAMRWDGSAIQFESITAPPNTSPYWRWVDVDKVGPNQFWGVAATNGGNYGTLVGEWTGSSFQPHTIPKLPVTYYELTAVGAVAANDVWVAGSEQTLNPSTPIAPYTIHWNGSTWTRIPTSGYVREFVTFASNDVWAFGTKIEHWNGSAWTVVLDYASTLQSAQSWGACATGPCDLWTVGTQWTGTAPPVVALAAHLGAANAGAATLRLPCTAPALRQSLLPQTLPRLGHTLRAQADDPLGTAGLSGGLLSAWLFANGPGPLAPCGVLVPGLGIGASSLEVLLDASATVGAVAAWAPGQPAEFAIPLPSNLALVGLSFASQAVFLTSNGLAATSALDLVLGQ